MKVRGLGFDSPQLRVLMEVTHGERTTDPEGEIQLILSKAAQKTGLNNAIRFQGKYLDDEGRPHCHRHRYCDPVMGRRKDRIGLAGGLNLAQVRAEFDEMDRPVGAGRREGRCSLKRQSLD